jgi:phosphomannomutase
MGTNSEIIFSRDIRGIYPNSLNERKAFEIGRAIVSLTKAEKVVVGRDGRFSSDILFSAFAKGVNQSAANVLDLGQVPSEYLYFASARVNCQAAVMITASHNPKEWNGFKAIKKENGKIDLLSGKEIENEMGNPSTTLGTDLPYGKQEKTDIWESFISHASSFINFTNIKPFKVAIDASGGMASKFFLDNNLLNSLPIKIIPLNFKVDGKFKSHSPNPLLDGSCDQIKKAIIKNKADFGFIFDGDADRIFLVDEKGNRVSGDIFLLIMAKYFLKKNPRSTVIYNLICSKAVPETIEKWGGRPIKTAVGTIYLREAMEKENGIIGGEVSGHYLFRNNFNFDSGLISFLTALEIISSSQKKVSKLVEELSLYVKAKDASFEIKEKDGIINALRNKYSSGRQDSLDGLTVDFNDWWFNARSSQTEPILRLTIEAENKKILKEKTKELSLFIKKNSR